MTMVLKELKEMQHFCAETFEFSAEKRYLVILSGRIGPSFLRELSDRFKEQGIQAAFCVMDEIGLRIFEMEHQGEPSPGN